MWISSEGGFNTLSAPEPLRFMTGELAAALNELSDEQLETLSQRAGELSDEVFDTLRSLELPPDEIDEFVGEPLPSTYTFSLPGGDLLEGLVAQLQTYPPRWRLDAAMVLEEAIDYVLDSRSDTITE